MKEMRNLYKNRLNESGSEVSFNQSIINHFEEYHTQQQPNGKQKLSVFLTSLILNFNSVNKLM